MPKALFLTQYGPGGPSLPPMRAEKTGDVQIVYTVNGVEHGGWVAMCAPIPGDPPTVVVLVQSTDETLDAIAELPNVAYIEEVLEVVDAK